MRLLAKAVADGIAPVAVFDPNHAQIKKIINTGVELPGVKYREHFDLGVRG